MSSAERQLAGLIEALEHRKQTHKLEAYKPYPFQVAFHNARGYRSTEPAAQRALMCANQVGKCNSISVLIDTKNGPRALRDIWGRECEVQTWPNGTRRVTAWVKKPAEECFRIEMSDGRWVECPRGHWLLTDAGFASIEEILPFLPKSVFAAPDFRESVRRGAIRLTGRLRGLWGRCFDCFRLRGGRLLSDAEGVLVFAPLPDGVRGRSLLLFYADALASRCTNIARLVYDRLASWYDECRFWGQCEAFSGPAYDTSDRVSCGLRREVQRSSIVEHPAHAMHVTVPHLCRVSSLLSPVTDGNKIVACYSVGVHNLYDMEVAERHNYRAAGLVHHNTLCGGMEAAIHLTGQYPQWWDGYRFDRPITMLCGGLTNESVRDLSQKELFGDPVDDRQLGTGTVPLDCIGERVRKAGVPDALDTVMVKYKNSGWSRVSFRAYEQGAKKHMGSRIDVGWCDEEPPEDIWSQYLRGTLATKGILYMTFTPEEGLTKVVYGFMNDLKPGQALIRATWDDAPHMNHERREQALAAIPAHQREMRSKGIPLRGSGLVYAVPEENITCEPQEIPRHWPRICGVDFGIDHAFAAVWLAWDRDRDVVYVVDVFKSGPMTEKMSEHVSQLNRRGKWIPVIWPHDGLNREKSSGIPLAEMYRNEGANMWHEPFSNPPAPGVDEGKGGNSVEFGIEHILNRMQTGRFKVSRQLRDWFTEWMDYHRDDGKIVKQFDDLMDATRYACLMLRHAQTETLKIRQQQPPQGATNW